MSVRVINPAKFEHFFGKQPTKFGALASEDMQVAFWYLQPNQSMVLYKHNNSQQIYVVLEGDATVEYYKDLKSIEGEYVPNALIKVLPPNQSFIPSDAIKDKIQIAVGDVVAVDPDTYHTVIAPADKRVVLVSIVSPEGNFSTFLPR